MIARIDDDGKIEGFYMQTDDPRTADGRETPQEPPEHLVKLAIECSTCSPCRSKRGSVIFHGDDVVGHGYNFKPRGFDCDGTAACKATCRTEAIHAEQFALLAVGAYKSAGCEILHVKTVDGELVPSGGPSCAQCSKLALASGIKAMWLYHEDGWRRYPADEWHRLSLAALSAGPATQEQETIARLEEEIAEAREACPIVRRQDYFAAPLKTLIDQEISQLFQWQSRAEKAEAELADANARIHRMGQSTDRDEMEDRIEALEAELAKVQSAGPAVSRETPAVMAQACIIAAELRRLLDDGDLEFSARDRGNIRRKAQALIMAVEDIAAVEDWSSTLDPSAPAVANPQEENEHDDARVDS